MHAKDGTFKIYSMDVDGNCLFRAMTSRTYGSGSVAVHLLYSGLTDVGQYEALSPGSSLAIDVESHKESVKNLRQINLEKYGDLKNAKVLKQSKLSY